MPQPAGAPVHRRPLAGRPAARRAARSATQAQYRRFAQAITQAGSIGFALPTPRAPWTPAHAALDATAAAQWLREQGIVDPLLRSYLDYCCRDDYGAGTATVSAWAWCTTSRAATASARPATTADDRDPVLTWPDGNAPLMQALRRAFAERVLTGRAVFRIDEGLHEVTAMGVRGRRGRALDGEARGRRDAAVHRRARARAPPAALVAAARQQRRAPWMVANLRLDAPAAGSRRRAAVVGQRDPRQPVAGLCRRAAPEPRARRRRHRADRVLGASRTAIASGCSRCRGRTRRS